MTRAGPGAGASSCRLRDAARRPSTLPYQTFSRLECKDEPERGVAQQQRRQPAEDERSTSIDVLTVVPLFRDVESHSWAPGWSSSVSHALCRLFQDRARCSSVSAWDSSRFLMSGVLLERRLAGLRVGSWQIWRCLFCSLAGC